MKNKYPQFFTQSIEDLNSTGVYKITCKSNNKIYIGSATRYKSNFSRNGFYGRWLNHIYKLKNGIHANTYLQNSWNKYGADDFIFEILEICSPEETIKKEYEYITKTNCTDNTVGFNIIKQSNFINTMCKEEVAKHLSELYKGKPRKLEDVKKWSTEIHQYDKNMNYIATYYSIAEASRQTGLQRQDIGQAAIGKKMKKCGGYYWKKLKI